MNQKKQGEFCRNASIEWRPITPLISTTSRLLGKGRHAVDESTKTIGKRLGSIGVENSEANRQAYRRMLFTTPGLTSV